MHQVTKVAGDDGIDAELVRPGVQAELVRPHGASNGRVPGELGFELAQIANVVHALLEATDVTRSQAHPLNAQPLEFTGDVIVLQRRRGRLRLVHRHFKLESLP